MGRKRPNGLGLYDMSGNVWEWVSGWYDKDYYRNSPKNDPPGSSIGTSKLYRGGSWNDIAGDARATYRGRDVPALRVDEFGFRLVLASQ